MPNSLRIYDPIHGYITLSDEEAEIVESSPFQRLRYIHQNGPAYLVYPTSTHNRFSHSLGTFYVMASFAGKLVHLEALNEVQERRLRLAALLHDIGHYPFSHMIRDWKSKRYPFPKHEEMAERIVNFPSISDIIENKEDRISIVDIINGQTTDLIEVYLMSSEIDVDRIDYLLRDAHFAGLIYGTIDLHRLVATVFPINSQGLAYEEKGMPAIENFLLARYHMYESVYNHKVVVGFRLLLERIHRLLAEKKQLAIFDSKNVLELDEKEWFRYNDTYLLSKMMERPIGNNALSEMIDDFFNRKPLAVADSITRFDRASPDNKFKAILGLKEPAEISELANISGIREEWIFYDRLNNQLIDLQKQKSPLKIWTGDDMTTLREYRPSLSVIARDELRVYTREKYVPQLRNGLAEYIKK